MIEEIGPYKELFIARSNEQFLLEAAQDGGAVNTLLYGCLAAGYSGALVCARDSNWRPSPFVARTKKDLLATAGTSYVNPSMLQPLNSLLEERYAMVATSCQVRALRNLQSQGNEAAQQVEMIIGLFCSESYLYQGLIQTKLQQDMGIDPTRIRKMNIKGKMIIELDDDTTAEIPLKELRAYTRRSCARCTDFTCEEADISVGSIGLNGYNFVMVRTHKGQALVNKLLQQDLLETIPLDENKKALELLLKVSRKKKTRGSPQ